MWFSRRVLSDLDNERLVATLDRARDSRMVYATHLDLFRAELRRARVVSPPEVPNDMITMESRFELTGPGPDETTTHRLVYPGEEEGPNDVSILSPMGRALLGARVGDEVCWISAVGPEVARIVKLIDQPEWRAISGVGA